MQNDGEYLFVSFEVFCLGIGCLLAEILATLPFPVFLMGTSRK